MARAAGPPSPPASSSSDNKERRGDEQGIATAGPFATAMADAVAICRGVPMEVNGWRAVAAAAAATWWS